MHDLLVVTDALRLPEGLPRCHFRVLASCRQPCQAPSLCTQPPQASASPVLPAPPPAASATHLQLALRRVLTTSQKRASAPALSPYTPPTWMLILLVHEGAKPMRSKMRLCTSSSLMDTCRQEGGVCVWCWGVELGWACG